MNSTYAQLYSKLDMTNGTRFLGFRDVPDMIKNYVKGDKALDYGCGPGNSSRFLRSLGFDVTGVDINQEMVNTAKSKDPTGEYHSIKSGRIHWTDDNTYDLVFSSWVMMEVSSKQELINIAKEIRRVLKSEGIFIMLVTNENTYNHDWLSENTEFEENRNLTSGSIVKVHIKDIDISLYDYFWTENDYKEILERAHLKLINIHKPLGTDQDGYAWVNEKIISPVSVFVAQKM